MLPLARSHSSPPPPPPLTPAAGPAADFYHANALLPLSDEAIVARVQAHLATCETAFASARVLDSAVLRFRSAVTHFAPGSYAHRPEQTTSLPGVFIAGDYVKGLRHGANGLSQERAYVTGLAAANLVIDRLRVGRRVEVLDVEADEPHIAAAKAAAKAARALREGLLGAESY